MVHSPPGQKRSAVSTDAQLPQNRACTEPAVSNDGFDDGVDGDDDDFDGDDDASDEYPITG